MLIKYGEETKKSSAPRCRTPESGSGCINTPHGTELYDILSQQAQKMPAADMASLLA